MRLAIFLVYFLYIGVKGQTKINEKIAKIDEKHGKIYGKSKNMIKLKFDFFASKWGTN